MQSLCQASAVELAGRIRSREVSCEEVMAAHLAQIDAVNGELNAIVTLIPDAAMDAARRADAMLARGVAVGPLHGLPIAHKDLALTAGIRTTFGSRAQQDFVPDVDGLQVARLKQAGALCIGKTNTPEFGAGSQTFNDVFGVTRNPYDPSRTCGGSSGGAAVALAARMIPIADGSDMGGSLRNPAAFCNIVGLRPTPGRVPTWPSDLPWRTLGVEGPMARNVEDCALLLRAMAGPDPRAPLSLPQSGDTFDTSLQRDFRGCPIAFSADFGGRLPMQPEVVAVVQSSAPVLEQLGCDIREGLPDLSGADRAFKTLRALIYATSCAAVYREHKSLLKDTLVWNIEQGLRLTGPQIGDAERMQMDIYQRMREFMVEHEFVVLPVTQVLPFDADTPYVTAIDGHELDTYLDWMRSCYFITVTGHPAISVPCGFTDDGLPVGLQIVGRYGDDLGVLQLAYAFEQATGFWKRSPPLAAHRGRRVDSANKTHT